MLVDAYNNDSTIHYYLKNGFKPLYKSLFKNKCLFQADGFLGKFHLSRRSIVGYVTETKMEFHKNPSEMR